MKFFIALVIHLNLALPICSHSQNLDTSISNDSVFTKWSKAVVNLECNNVAWLNYYTNYLNHLNDSLRHHQIDNITYRVKIDSIIDLFVSNRGTAIFLRYDSERYLVTARHVIARKSKFDRIKINVEQTIPIMDTSIYDRILKSYVLHQRPERTEGPELTFEKNLRYYQRPYLFSDDEETDIAVISLDSWKKGKEFADYLEYFNTPITISDIDTICNLKVGEELICVGFPSGSFVWDTKDWIHRLNGLYNDNSNLISNLLERPIYVSEVAATFGRVSTAGGMNTFRGDITIMPGNSGGPVISNNKLVGIVSGQTQINVEDEKGKRLKSYQRLPYLIGIRSSVILYFLRQMKNKEKYAPYDYE